MGIDNMQFFVDKVSLTLQDGNTQNTFIYEKENIDKKLFNDFKKNIDENKLRSLVLENVETDVGITIFCENGVSHFGIVDLYNDVNHYYDNGSGDITLIDIGGQVFEKRMICNNNELLYETILFFSLNGGRNPKILWIEE